MSASWLDWRFVAECIGVFGVGIAAWSVVRTIRSKRVGADVLALLALIGALVIGQALAAAVITVMLATGLGLEARASRRANRELSALVQRQPTNARRRTAEGIETIPVTDVRPGDSIVVATADVVPVDGLLVDRSAVIDASAITGEPLPRAMTANDEIVSGTVNAGPPFTLRASATSEDSTYAGLVRLASESSATSAPLVRLADRVATVFLFAGLGIAGAAWLATGDFARAVAVLVVATPCPLILAVPIAVSSGLSRAASRGIVVKGGAVLEQLASTTTVLFDKTGTLTVGRPEVTSILAAGERDPGEVLVIAATIDQLSSHVIATGIVRGASDRGLRLRTATAVVEDAGNGTSGLVDGTRVRIGRSGWLGIADDHPLLERARRIAARVDGTLVLVEIDGQLAGAIVLADRIRPEASRTIRRLRRLGVHRLAMVTGDRQEPAAVIGALADLDDVLAARSPSEKVADIEAAKTSGPVVMVGDGINDAPALTAADVGIAMGGRGGTAATETADVVLGLDRLDRVADVIAIAQRSTRIARQSAVIGLGLSLVAMGFAAVGLLAPTWGALVQEAIDVAVILNALRALRMPAGFLELEGADAALAVRFGREHAAMRPRLDRLLELADALGNGTDPHDLEPAKEALKLLRDEIEPHELAEATDLYPVIDTMLGGADPTAPMARGHVEITRLIDRLEQLLGELDSSDQSLTAADLGELRRLLYGLHAVLVLHNSQEEEGYLSLVDAG